MKKQLFSLMLSAAIFTTSPLFAMDDDVKTGSPHVSQKEDTRFHDKREKYTVTMEEIQSWKKQPNVVIGKKTFKLDHFVVLATHVDKDTGINLINPKAFFAFSWKEAWELPGYGRFKASEGAFQGSAAHCPASAHVLDLDSQECLDLSNKALNENIAKRNSAIHQLHGFTIREIKDSEKN